MRQIVRTAKSIQRLKKRWLLCSGTVSPSLRWNCTTRYIRLGKAYLPLIVRSGDKTKEGRIDFWSFRTPSPNEVLLFFQTVNFVNQLRIMKYLAKPMNSKKRKSIADLVLRNVKTWAALRDRRSLGSWESVVQTQFYDNWNQKRFQFLASQAGGYSSHEPQTSLNCSQKPQGIENLQPLKVCYRPGALHSALQLLTGFMMETLH